MNVYEIIDVPQYQIYPSRINKCNERTALTLSRLPATVAPQPDAVQRRPSAKVAVDAGSAITATYALSVNGEVSSMMARSLDNVTFEYSR